MKLIVGLGNPGTQYERTRHNVGFMIVDALAIAYRLSPISTAKHKADVFKGEIEGKRTLLAKPLTYMNDSGVAVQALLNFYKLTPNDLVVIHDDKDIPLGETRVQKGRGAAGHNGIKSIIEHLGTKDFTRIRVGIGFPPLTKGRLGGVADAATSSTGKLSPNLSWKERGLDTADFVLGKFTKDEQKTLKDVILHVKGEVENLLR